MTEEEFDEVMGSLDEACDKLREAGIYYGFYVRMGNGVVTKQFMDMTFVNAARHLLDDMEDEIIRQTSCVIIPEKNVEVDMRGYDVTERPGF